MDNTLIAERVGIGLSKAKVTDLQQRRRKRKARHRYLPPVEPKANVQVGTDTNYDKSEFIDFGPNGGSFRLSACPYL